MDEKELYNWSVYLKEETPDVNELQMAILSNMISAYMGNKDTKYTNFLIRKQKEDKSTDKPISNYAIKSIFQTLGAV